jgi:hypothetical protein
MRPARSGRCCREGLARRDDACHKDKEADGHARDQPAERAALNSQLLLLACERDDASFIVQLAVDGAEPALVAAGSLGAFVPTCARHGLVLTH